MNMEIDFSKVEFGDGHGNLCNFFKNIYYEKRYIGRTYDKSTFLKQDERTYIYFPGKPFLKKNQEKILIEEGCFLDDTAECEEKFYPYAKKFENNEDEAIAWWGKMIEKIGLDLDEHYPKEKNLV